MEQREEKYISQPLNFAVRELVEFRALEREIKYLTQKLEEYRARYDAGVHGTDYTGIRVQGGVPKDTLVEIAILWADLSVSVERKKAEAEKQRIYLLERLKALSPCRRRVLELYYLQDTKISDIAMIMNYSERQVIRIKKEALWEFARI